MTKRRFDATRELDQRGIDLEVEEGVAITLAVFDTGRIKVTATCLGSPQAFVNEPPPANPEPEPQPGTPKIRPRAAAQPPFVRRVNMPDSTSKT